MPSTAENLARTRYERAFTMDVPYVGAVLTSRRQVSAFNRRMRIAITVANARRVRIEQQLLVELSKAIQPQFKRLFTAAQRGGQMDAMADDAARIYQAIRKRGEREATTHRRLVEYLQKSKRDDAVIVSHLREAAADGNVEFGAIPPIFETAMILWYESAARTMREVTADYKKSIPMLLLAYKAVPSGFSPTDWLFVNEVYAHQPFELWVGIAERMNEITVPGFTNSMFETLKDTMDVELYQNVKGAEGARGLARKMGQDLAVKYNSTLPPITKDKLMLWARTEGCVVQNDALIKIGGGSGMQGKGWFSMGDERVRPAHTDNEGDGIIHKDEDFSDGSSDAGSGSVSPFFCRCSSYPALLPKGTAMPKPKVRTPAVLRPLLPVKKPRVKPPVPLKVKKPMRIKPKPSPKKPKLTQEDLERARERTRRAKERLDKVRAENVRLKREIERTNRDTERTLAERKREIERLNAEIARVNAETARIERQLRLEEELRGW